MITFTRGNLLHAEAEALVNTVNTVGVMGKGIALMFKEEFPDNFRFYEAACKSKSFDVGQMLLFHRTSMIGPKWIINFPTKRHWRQPSKIQWIEEGLVDLKKVIAEHQIKSIALPPLGSGNGGLAWLAVRELIVSSLQNVPHLEVIVYEPTSEYQNVAKRTGVQKLTVARALIAELVRRYSIIGIDCSLLEVQKLAYFAERIVADSGLPNPFDFHFIAHRYGPYTPRLTHLLNSLDGSYLHCDKRLADAGPFDAIRFDDTKRDVIAAYLTSEAKAYIPALNATANLIDGFESPLGLELLATLDWILKSNKASNSVENVRRSLHDWPGGEGSGERKLRLFENRMIESALEQLRFGNLESA